MNKLPIPNILFDDLYIESKYKSLTAAFLYIDFIRHRNNNEKSTQTELDELKFSEKYGEYFDDNLEIIEQTILEVEMETLDFEKDFLIPAIQNIPYYYQYRLKKYSREKSIYSDSSKINFYEDEIDKLMQTVDKIQETSLDSIVTTEAVSSCYSCMDYIKDAIDKIQNKTFKIPFNMSKVDVLNLFHKLYKSELISNSITPSELATLMQNSFYYDKDKDLTGIYKEFNEYSSGRKSLQASDTRLSKNFEKILKI